MTVWRDAVSSRHSKLIGEVDSRSSLNLIDSVTGVKSCHSSGSSSVIGKDVIVRDVQRVLSLTVSTVDSNSCLRHEIQGRW